MRRVITVFALLLLLAVPGFAQQSQSGSVTVFTDSGSVTANVTSVGSNFYVSTYKSDGGDARLSSIQITDPVLGRVLIEPPVFLRKDSNLWSVRYDDRVPSSLLFTRPDYERIMIHGPQPKDFAYACAGSPAMSNHEPEPPSPESCAPRTVYHQDPPYPIELYMQLFPFMFAKPTVEQATRGTELVWKYHPLEYKAAIMGGQPMTLAQFQKYQAKVIKAAEKNAAKR